MTTPEPSPAEASPAATGTAGTRTSVADDHAGHAHGHHHGPPRGLQRRALWLALAANGAFMVVEAIGGIAFSSLALLADAAHMLSDVAGLAIALVALQLLSRPATRTHSFGLQRAEVLGGQVNALLLLGAAAYIVYEAVQRIGSPADIDGGGMLVVAVLGLLVNVGSAWLLARSKGQSLNMQGAFLHMVLDAAASVGAIIAAVAVIVWNADWVDPAISIVLSVLVVWSAWSLLRDTTHVMLEGTPRHVDLEAIEAALVGETSVSAVHHVHAWSLASDVTALSAHVVLDDVESLHDAQEEGERLKSLLHDDFGIDHTTLELECHPCAAPDDDDIARSVGSPTERAGHPH